MYAAVHRNFELEKIQLARNLVKRCLEADPDFARAHVLLSATQTTTYALRVKGSTDLWNPAVLNAAYDSASRAVQLAPNLPEARAQLGYVYAFQHRHDMAVGEFERAFSLNQNFTDWRFCPTLLWSGYSDRAIEAAHRHLRFDPFALPIARGYLGYALLTAKRYDDALQPLTEFVANAPGHPGGRLWLAACYSHLGQFEKARAEVAIALEKWPEISIANGLMKLPYRNIDEIIITLMRSARSACLIDRFRRFRSDAMMGEEEKARPRGATKAVLSPPRAALFGMGAWR